MTADLSDPSSLGAVHHGVDVAVVGLPAGNSPDQQRAEGANVLDVLRESGIQKVIWNTSVDFPSRAEELPAFAVKRELESDVLASGLQVTVLRAPFLLSNLLLPYASSAIGTHGLLTYPVASDVPLCWAAPEDLGRLASLVIHEDQYGRIIHAGAKSRMTGPQLAAAFSKALRRPIQYQALDLDAFEAGVDAAIGAGVGKSVGLIFRFIERHPDDRDFVSTTCSVPSEFAAFEPTGVTEWVAANAGAFVGDAQPVATGAPRP